ncbi:MAG TPA: MXAN_5187 C-terminal domain-containing protein [Thermoanaerobaculia bacterium]|nr:MXAN_5187 C-terminal domain-containing protein [Thermoanaerobaculia bacterium]
MDPKRSPKRGPAPAPPSPSWRPGAPASPGAAPGTAAPGAGGAEGGAALGGQAKKAGPGLSEAIDRLGRDIQQLRIDFERFFSGALPQPPSELRNRIQAQLRNLRNVTAATAVDSFRLADLEARCNSYGELYERRLREREEGRSRGVRVPPPATPPPPSAAALQASPARRFDLERGIVVGASVDPQAVEALYGRLSAAGEGSRFDRESFGAYLLRQAAAIRHKTGCAEVQFRLASEDGKIKLKARPVGGSPGAGSRAAPRSSS